MSHVTSYGQNKQGKKKKQENIEKKTIYLSFFVHERVMLCYETMRKEDRENKTKAHDECDYSAREESSCIVGEEELKRIGCWWWLFLKTHRTINKFVALLSCGTSRGADSEGEAK